MSNTSETITGRLDVGGLSKLERFFQTDFATVAGELLQNSRRAGASTVTVTTSKPAAGTGEVLVTWEDDGGGIEDPSVLLFALNSGWDVETKVDEDPAGLGFFSLLGVIQTDTSIKVQSQDWRVDIDRQVFLGSKSAPVVRGQTFMAAGTRISFVCKEVRHPSIEDIIAKASKFSGMRLVLNGETREAIDFLTGYHVLGEFHGCRVGALFKAWDTHGYKRIDPASMTFGTDYSECVVPYRHMTMSYSMLEPEVNFYGIDVSMPDKFSSSHGLDRIRFWLERQAAEVVEVEVIIRIDIRTAMDIKMKLPDRKSVLAGAKVDDLGEKIRKAILQLVFGNMPGMWHNWNYNHWQIMCAKYPGVNIPQAMPYLNRYQASTASEEDGFEEGIPEWSSADKRLVRVTDADRIVAMPDIAMGMGDCTNNALVLGATRAVMNYNSTAKAGKEITMVDMHAGMVGYAWYDAVHKLHAVDVHSTNKHGATTVLRFDPVAGATSYGLPVSRKAKTGEIVVGKKKVKIAGIGCEHKALALEVFTTRVLPDPKAPDKVTTHVSALLKSSASHVCLQTSDEPGGFISWYVLDDLRSNKDDASARSMFYDDVYALLYDCRQDREEPLDEQIEDTIVNTREYVTKIVADDIHAFAARLFKATGDAIYDLRRLKRVKSVSLTITKVGTGKWPTYKQVAEVLDKNGKLLATIKQDDLKI